MITDDFKRAGLDIQILSDPIRKGRGMDEIVQLDIERKTQGTRRTERFRIYMGNKNNLVQVRDVDKPNGQLVLMVREPAREFDEDVRITKWDTEDKILARLKVAPRRIKYRKVGNKFVVTQKIDEAVRYFLAGVDERQLFIAQLTGPATTVVQARKSLGKSVEFANGDRRKGSSLDRQGEWFFLKADATDCCDIHNALLKTCTTIQKKVSIGTVMGRRGGNSHTADELVKLPSRHFGKNFRSPGLSRDVQGRDRVFVRGCVRHVDHKTVKFTEWREVIANSEGETATASASGVFWVD